MNTSLFLKSFPVPKYMNMDGVGISLSEEAIHFVKIISGKNGFEIKSFGEYPVPEGAFYQGKIKNPNALGTVLSRVSKEHHIQFAYSTLPEAQTYLVEMEIPMAKNSELHGSIELQIDEHIPLSPSEAVFDYHISRFTKSHGNTTTVLVSATLKEVAQSYVDLFRMSGITLLSLETEAQALSRSIVPEKIDDTVMIVDLSRSKTGVYIHNHDMVQFALDLDFGLGNVESIVEGDQKQPILEKLTEEVNKLFNYWHSFREKSTITSGQIGKIILCGEGAVVPGIPDFFASRLHVPVEIANVWVNVFSLDKYVPQITLEESLKYAVAIGLSLHPRD